MLASTNAGEIQEFLENKVPYITKELRDQLVSRIIELKSDEVIEEDWRRKSAEVQHKVV